MIKNFTKKTLLIGLAIFFGATASIAYATILPVPQGGTGWGNPDGFQSGSLLVGNGLNPIATTSQATNGQVLQYNGTTYVPVNPSSLGGDTFGQGWEINTAGALSPTTTIPIAIPSPSTSTIANLEGALYADNFAGADIGAKINAAYAALPANGGVIVVPTGNYSFSTEIVFNVANKNATLQCLSAGDSTRLVWTGSGTSTVMNTAPANSHPIGWGVNNCTFTGPETGLGGTSVGLEVGGTIGGAGFTLNNVRFQKFDKNIVEGNNTYQTNFNNIYSSNAREVFAVEGKTNAGEAIKSTNSNFDDGYSESDSFAAAAVSTCVNFPTSSTASADFLGGSIDDCTLFVGDGNLSINLFGVHQENPGVTSNFSKQYTYIVNLGTNGFNSLNIYGGTIMNDASTTQYAPNQYVLNSGRVKFYGTTFDQNNTGVPVAAVSNFGANASVEVYGLAKIGVNLPFNTFATSSIAFYNDAKTGLTTVGTKLGVGTTSPISTFTVSGSTPTITFYDSVSNQRWDWFNSGNKLRLTNSISDIFTVLNGGNIGMGSTTPGTSLGIGNTGVNTINLSATATSTFGSGISLRSGCFAVNGVCLTTGAGTVTSISTNNGITGGPITGSGTIGLDVVNANSVLGNISGVSAVPTSLSTTTLFAAAAGQILGFINGGWTGVATTTFSNPLVYSGGNVTCQAASGSLAGCLSATDWNTFNNKQPTIALGAGTVNSSAGNVLYSTATSTVAIGSGLSYSGTMGSEVGGVSGTLTVTGLTTSNFASANVSQFTNDAGYLTSATARPYDFPLSGNATSTLTQFNGGITAFASSTIGNGITGNGLTINGNSTTTLAAYFGSQVSVGSTTPYALLSLDGKQNSIAAGLPILVLQQQTGGTADIFDIFTSSQSKAFNLDQFGTPTSGNGYIANGGSGSPSAAFLAQPVSASTPGFRQKQAANATGNFATLVGSVNQTLFAIGAQGNLQIGTTTTTAPAWLSVQAAGITTAYGSQLDLVNIASTTSATFATSSIFKITASAHLMGSSTNPVISGCGTSPTVNGDDSHGYVTVGSVSATGCTITFANAYPARPQCNVTNETMSLTSAFGYTVSASAITVTQATGLVGDVLDYSCRGF